jgi:hypothetical protein
MTDSFLYTTPTAEIARPLVEQLTEDIRAAMASFSASLQMQR